MRIDHVLIATADPDAAAARLETSHGLVAAGGGRHDRIGTHNRIVPLGGGYLELIGVADPGEAASSPLGRVLSERIAAVGEGLMGWAVAVDNVAATAGRLGTELSVIARQGLSARLAGVASGRPPAMLASASAQAIRSAAVLNSGWAGWRRDRPRRRPCRVRGL